MPNSITILAPAKINLCLDILRRTASGYHEIQTIFQEIPEIYDEIKIETAKETDKLSTTYSPNFQCSKSPTPPLSKILHPTNPSDLPPEQNLAFLALQLLKKTYKIKKFAHITIKKNIPHSSGLGGASSDAAAVLKGLNKLWNLKIPTEKLLSLAAKLGMDVPFFIIGGTALGTHFGEKITPLPPLRGVKFKIFPKSGHPSKTAIAYASINLSLCGKNISKTKKMIKILTTGKASPINHTDNSTIHEHSHHALLATLHNDFETLPIHKNLPPGHHLSGSGPSTYSVWQLTF